MAAKDCLAAIKKAAPDLTEDEVTEIFEALDEVKKTHRSEEKLASMEEKLKKAAVKMAEDKKVAAILEKRRAAITWLRFNDLKERIRVAFDATGEPFEGMRAFAVGVNQPFAGARSSIDARRLSLEGEYLGLFVHELTVAKSSQGGNLLRELLRIGTWNRDADRKFEHAIAEELWDLSQKTPSRKAVSGNTDARAIAEVMVKVRKLAISRENRMGAFIGDVEGFITSQMHDQDHIRRAGFAQWRDFMLSTLDHDRTFEGIDDKEGFLKSVYAALSTGEHLKSEGDDYTDLPIKFKGPGNLARRVSAHRKLHFKDARAFMDYNDRFGHKSMLDAYVSGLRRAAQNTALMETLGPNPEAMWKKMIDWTVAEYRDKVALSGKKPTFDADRAQLERIYKEISGQTHVPISDSMLAAFGQMTRGVITMAKLGTSAISSVVDMATVAAEIHKQTGKGFIESWGKAFQGIFDSLSGGEQRRFAELLGVGLEGQFGYLAARFSANDHIPGKMAKILRLYFKLNLLGPWTDMNKRGLGLGMMRDLALESVSSFDQINPATRKILELYNVDAQKWEVLRLALRNDAEGRSYMMPDVIKHLPDSAFAPLLPKRMNKTAKARKIARLKDQLSIDLRSYIADRAETAVPTPGARERAIMIQGTRAGTASGEFWRFLMQFKAFPITFTTRVLGGTMEAGSSLQLFKNTFTKGKGDTWGLVHLMAATTVMGYLAHSTKEVLKGRTPRSLAEPNTWMTAMLQGGGWGIYGDFLFGEFSRFGRTPLETAAGPFFSEAAQLIATLSESAREGRDPTASLIRQAANNTPNILMLRTAMDYLFLYNLYESASPGYLRRMERRMEQEQGQKMLFPPSHRIPHGGTLFR